MKTLILGLGNPILGDDSIGWKVVEQVKILSNHGKDTHNYDKNWSGNHLEYDCYSLGGISLMEHLIGYDRIWIIDAIHTGKHPIGTIIHQKLEDFQDIPCGHLTSPHDMTLQTAIDLGRSVGADLPKEIYIIGIEADLHYVFTEDLSEPLRKAFPEVVNKVMHMIQQEVTYDLS
jgi:hydrogenase maturation protease